MSKYSGVAESNLKALNASIDTLVATTLTATTLTATTLGVTTLTAAGTLTGNVVATAGYIQLRVRTAAQIAAIADVVNTTGKVAGTIVFDTTNTKLKIATGADANSTWVDAAGTNAVTPS